MSASVDHADLEFAEIRLAERFADRVAGDWRYCDEWNRWMIYTHHKWEEDKTRKTFSVAREIAKLAAKEREALNDSGARSAAAKIASAKTRAAIVSLASDDQRLAVRSDQWDADPWLLNTPDGAYDLRTGQRRRNAREDYVTKSTAVAPQPGCKRWLEFLDEVTAGDKDLQGYLQRIAGYCLTGSTQEHALFFLYGVGANGKSVFVDTLRAVFGDYAITSNMEAFTESHNDRHATELARLRGARLVTAGETEEGKQWAESKIKQLTGERKIAARFMRENFFEFTPQFKLLFAGNHKPSLRSVGEDMRRRVNLIPFTVTIPEEKRDPRLLETLEAVWPGILQWAIDGCVQWQREGLKPPKAVIEATASYFAEEDALSDWLDERCLLGPSVWTPSGQLFADWRAWADARKEDPRNKKWLAKRLEAKSCHAERMLGVRAIRGIALRQDSSHDG